MNPGSRNTPAITIGIIVLILIIAGGVSALTKKDDTSDTVADATATPVVAEATATPTPDPDATVDPSATPTPTPVASPYKDGTYSATGSYSTPGGTEEIEVSLTLANGVVTASTVTSDAISDDAKEFQAEFIGSYMGQVVGKKIDGLILDKVSGSSLTSKGFNSAVSAIKSQAS